MAVEWDTLTQLYYGGAYNLLDEITLSSPGVTLERGTTDDFDLKAGVCSFRLLDDADRYRPSNAASDLYGVTGPWMRGAFATGASVRFTGEAQYMNPGQTEDHAADNGVSVRGYRWVDVRLSGPLGRVGAWRDPLASPLFTQIQGAYASTLRGYWPLDDGRDSTGLQNVSHPSRPGRGTLLTYDADGPAGGGAAVELQTGGSLSFPYATMSVSAGWQLVFAARIANVDATLREVFTWRTSVGYTWRWRVNSTAYNLLITDALGATILDQSVLHGTGAAPGQWIVTRLRVQIVGSNVQVEAGWFADLAEQFLGITWTYSGGATSMGAPLAGTVPANAATAGARYSDHFVVAGVTDDLEASAFTSAFVAYRRERAAARFARLCGSRGLPYLVRGTSSRSAPMGPQPTATFQDQLKQIRVSEGGMIFDRGDNRGIVLATRDYLLDKALDPVLDLLYPDDLSGTLEEVTSAADLFNLVTAVNTTGSSSSAELTTGRTGTQSPPTGAGRLDKKVDVNVASDGQLVDVAHWWLAWYSQPGPRFETLVVDVDAHPELLADCNAAEPGMFVRVTGRTPDPLLMIIFATAQRTNRSRNVFTFTVATAAPFRAGVYDDPESRYDSSSTTLNGAHTAGTTSLALETTYYADRWSTTAVPYDLMLAGERVTVTAMTAATFSTGKWRQTATVTRAENGVSKAQTSGTTVSLADPVYYG